MKKYFFTLMALLTFSFTKAQTADEIISKHIDAIGGKSKLSQVTSLYMESATEIMGVESETKTTILNGKGYRNESDFNGQKIVQVITDKGGWMINPFSGSSEATALPADQYQAGQDQVFIAGPLYDYAAHGGKVELMGREKVREINTYKLKYTNKDGKETFFYIDPTTYYVLQTVRTGDAMGQEVTVTIGFSNYQKTDAGISIPYSTDIDMGQFALKVNVKKVETNKTVDPAIFEMPK
jgi:fructose-specific component phosphotransferase system IIB-like protein